eukprot:NODE_779_length_3939_cov_0.376563.p1 type:complete len:497 gc:universal NODE_779_length_3939_cov_0.376563:2759-1269(-)
MSSYLESIAHLLSRYLTNKETEHVIHRLNSIQKHLKRPNQISNKNKCQHDLSCNVHAIRSFTRSVFVTFLIKHLLSVFSLSFKHKSTSNKFLNILYGLLSGILRPSKDTLVFTLFMSTYITAYKSFKCLFTNISSEENPKTIIQKSKSILSYAPSLFSGILSSLTILLDSNTNRRYQVMYFITSRSCYQSLHYLLKSSENSPTFDLYDSFTPTVEDHAEQNKLTFKKMKTSIVDFIKNNTTTWIFSINTCIILYNIVFNPKVLPRSYRQFLFHICGTPEMIKEYNKAYATKDLKLKDSLDLMSLIKHNALHNTPPALVCQEMHPNQSHVYYYVKYFMGIYYKCIQLYFPLNMIHLVLFKFSFSKIVKQFKYSVFNSLRSSLFLTTLCTITFSVPCMLRLITGKEQHYFYVANGFLSGFSLLLENQYRRMELMLYMLPRTLETLHQLFRTRSKAAGPMGLAEYLVFIISNGMMMHVYTLDRQIMGAQGNMMARIFGL